MKAPCTHRLAVRTHAWALCLDLRIQQDLRVKADAAGQAARQLAGIELLAWHRFGSDEQAGVVEDIADLYLIQCIRVRIFQ
jgi:hypothetical protein